MGHREPGGFFGSFVFFFYFSPIQRSEVLVDRSAAVCTRGTPPCVFRHLGARGASATLEHDRQLGSRHIL